MPFLLCGATVHISNKVIVNTDQIAFIQIIGEWPHRVMKVGIIESSNALIVNEDDIGSIAFNKALKELN